MDARLLVAERQLVPRAASLLATRAFTALPLDALGPTKALLKRFFSAAAWGEADDQALAAAVGPGQGWWREPLDDDLALEFGWAQDRFVLRVDGVDAVEGAGSDPGTSPEGNRAGEALAATFDGPVVPEATPNPRTLMFRTGPIHEGESRPYRSLAETDDPRVARLFRSFPDLAAVLVARDFVALTLRRPDRWEALLPAVLEAVSEEFAGADAVPAAGPGPAPTPTAPAPGRAATPASESRLDRAWRELGSLRPGDAADLARLVAAAGDPDGARRQVAANLLAGAPPQVAGAEWARLVQDPSRLVRRAAVDAMVDAGREELRPLLERALADADAWVRWKALRGLSELGAQASRAAIAPLAADPDFRVRLEAEAALRT